MTFVCAFVCTIFLLAFEVAVDLLICFLFFNTADFTYLAVS